MTELTKSYQSTIDEAVSANYRTMEVAGLLRRQFWQTLGSMVTIGAVVMALVPLTIPGRLVAFGAFAVGCAIALRLGFEWSMRWQIRKSLVTMIGTDQPTECVCTLTAEQITCVTFGHTMAFRWESLRNYRETPSVLEIQLRPAGIIAIPKRIFDEPELSVWREYISSRVHDSKPNGA